MGKQHTSRNTLVIFKNNEEKENSKICMEKLSNKKSQKSLKIEWRGVFVLPDAQAHHKAGMLETLGYLCEQTMAQTRNYRHQLIYIKELNIAEVTLPINAYEGYWCWIIG